MCGRPIRQLTWQPRSLRQTLYVHPIKSCRGTSIPEVRYIRDGLYLDRTWLIINVEKKRFKTARELPLMVLINPNMDLNRGLLRIEVPLESQGKGVVTVETLLEPTAEHLANCQLVRGITLWKSTVDGYAVSPEADRVLSEVVDQQKKCAWTCVASSPSISPRMRVPATFRSPCEACPQRAH